MRAALVRAALIPPASLGTLICCEELATCELLGYEEVAGFETAVGTGVLVG